jgi:hypothetical protein
MAWWNPFRPGRVADDAASGIRSAMDQAIGRDAGPLASRQHDPITARASTIPIVNVVPATGPLDELPYKQAVETRL